MSKKARLLVRGLLVLVAALAALVVSVALYDRITAEEPTYDALSRTTALDRWDSPWMANEVPDNEACVSNLEEHLAAAENAGITQEEIGKIVKIAAFIKGRAASHVERLAGISEEEDEEKEAAKALAEYRATFGGG